MSRPPFGAAYSGRLQPLVYVRLPSAPLQTALVQKHELGAWKDGTKTNHGYGQCS